MKRADSQYRIQENLEKLTRELSIEFRRLSKTKNKIIRISPKNDARYFEIQYVYEAVEDRRELDKTKALAIDLGVDNLATCATSTGEAFIVDGRRLKSINQWYNKENARLQSIKDNQKFVNIPFGKLRSKLQYLCEFYGIDYYEQEESYTSRASFWDKDKIPVYSSDNQIKYEFSAAESSMQM